MCLANVHNMQSGKRGVDAGNVGKSPHDYSHIFNDIQRKLIIYRALWMHRLVQDPFYRIMNVSSAARLWMLRHLIHVIEHAQKRYHVNLLQFFRSMGRTEVLKFLRYKNAPSDMITLWNAQFPPRRTSRVNYKRCAVRVVKNHHV